MNTLLDWQPILKIIKKHYTKGRSATGNSGYSGLLPFKMSLLQTWYCRLPEKQLLKIEQKLNNKPRNIIGYKTPKEILDSEMKNVA